MTDRELLEKASKAVGYVPHHSYREKTNSLLWISESGFPSTWKPLTDDGDALRLAVDLGITIYTNIRTAYVFYGNHPINADEREITATEEPGEDSYAATRRAIVRAAAQIGEHMEKQNGN